MWSTGGKSVRLAAELRWMLAASAWCGALACACIDLSKYHLDETLDAAGPAAEGGNSAQSGDAASTSPQSEASGSQIATTNGADGQGGAVDTRGGQAPIDGAGKPLAADARIDGGEPDGAANVSDREAPIDGYIADSAAAGARDGAGLSEDAELEASDTGKRDDPGSLVDCGPPGKPSDGEVSAPTTTLGSTARYSCKEGYYRRGVQERTCQVTGTWTDATPTCEFVDCKALPNPANGAVQAARTTYGAEAQYTCPDGYDLSGPARRTCQANATWSGSATTCVPKDCGPLANPVRGNVGVTGTTYGSAAKFTCTAPSVLSGSALRTCQANGAWSGLAPVCTPPKSCQGGGVGAGMNCGGAEGTDDCCASPLVEGGTFNRDNNASYPATVSSFRLDKYEITVGRFRAFVAAGMGTQASPPNWGQGAVPNVADSGWSNEWPASLDATTSDLISGVQCSSGGWETWTGNDDKRPMNCITWYEAFAFCIWDGGRLPTDVEWNYAAAGGNEQRQYPWGNTEPGIITDLAVYLNNFDEGSCIGVGCVAPVGSAIRGSGKWGQADLAGNLWEWNLDWYAETYPNGCNNCTNTVVGSDRVLRGGDFRSKTASMLASSTHNHYAPSTHSSFYGARCARVP